jgi:hypothetical protein
MQPNRQPPNALRFAAPDVARPGLAGAAPRAEQGWLTGDPLVRFLLLISAMIWPGLSGINGTASSARLIVYPLGVTALPLWFADGRMKTRLHGRFPWQADLLITLPWPIDLIGNRSNVFDTVSWWD